MKATLLLLALGILFLQHIVAQQYKFGVGASGANESEISIVPMGANRFNPGSYIGGPIPQRIAIQGRLKMLHIKAQAPSYNVGLRVYYAKGMTHEKPDVRGGTISYLF